MDTGVLGQSAPTPDNAQIPQMANNKKILFTAGVGASWSELVAFDTKQSPQRAVSGLTKIEGYTPECWKDDLFQCCGIRSEPHIKPVCGQETNLKSYGRIFCGTTRNIAEDLLKFQQLKSLDSDSDTHRTDLPVRTVALYQSMK
jgi:hypothetical protein